MAQYGIIILLLALPMTTDNGSPFPMRDTLIFVTISTVIIMMVVQGIGMGPLLRWLKIEKKKDKAEEAGT